MGSKGTNQQVSKVYYDVIDEVIQNVQDIFTDEGTDEAVLQELKTLCKKKLEDSKALEPPVEEKKYIYKQVSEPTQREYMRVIPSTRPGQPQRIALSTQGGGGGGGANRVHRIVTSGTQQPVYRSSQGDSINSGSGGNVIYRTVQRSEPGGPVGRIVQQRTEGGGTKNIIVRQPNMNRGVTRVIQSGSNTHVNSPQVIVRSSGDPQRQGSVIRGNIITHVQNQLDGDLTDDEDTDDTESEESEPEEQQPVVEEDPLGSGDDIDDGDDDETFETDNVVVCQFDKIQRVRSKWRFQLKDGIMSLKGKDHVFQKANGDAEW